MRRVLRLAWYLLFPLAIGLSIAGCHKDQATVQPDNNQANTQDQNVDPAAANLPPTPDNSSTQAPTSDLGPQPDQASYDPG